MAAYLVMEFEAVHDPDLLATYRERSGPLVKEWGGKFIARAAPALVLEGNWGRVAITEFPTWDAALGLINSPEYVELAAIRKQAATARLLLIGSAKEQPIPEG
jgi:uncharacterized protein (DUF1330 family)